MDNLKESLWHSRGYALILFFTLAWALVTHDEVKQDQEQKTDPTQAMLEKSK